MEEKNQNRSKLRLKLIITLLIIFSPIFCAIFIYEVSGIFDESSIYLSFVATNVIGLLNILKIIDEYKS